MGTDSEDAVARGERAVPVVAWKQISSRCTKSMSRATLDSQTKGVDVRSFNKVIMNVGNVISVIVQYEAQYFTVCYRQNDNANTLLHVDMNAVLHTAGPGYSGPDCKHPGPILGKRNRVEKSVDSDNSQHCVEAVQGATRVSDAPEPTRVEPLRQRSKIFNIRRYSILGRWYRIRRTETGQHQPLPQLGLVGVIILRQHSQFPDWLRLRIDEIECAPACAEMVF
jgi:hypothetical protein